AAGRRMAWQNEQARSGDLRLRMVKRTTLWAAMVLCVSLSAFATHLGAQQNDEPKPQQPNSATPEPSAENGKKVFVQNCGVCHANDATGGRGPDLLRSSVLAHDVKGDQLGEVIRQGRPDKGMPPIPLTDQEIAEVAAFLHARVKEGLQSSRVPKVYDL